MKRPGLSSSTADEIDLAHGDLTPDESQNDPEDRKWFLTGRKEFITDLELRTYVHTMGWNNSSNSGREDWLRIIVANLDAALSGAPKIKRDRPAKVPVSTIAAPSEQNWCVYEDEDLFGDTRPLMMTFHPAGLVSISHGRNIWRSLKPPRWLPLCRTEPVLIGYLQEVKMKCQTRC
jgi:hypothetical protein